MNTTISRLNQDVTRCRRDAQSDPSSPCHDISIFECQASGWDPDSRIPAPSESSDRADIIIVGVNPRCTGGAGEPQPEAGSRRDTGATYHAYLRHLLSSVCSEASPVPVTSCIDLVQCGTEDGGTVRDVIDHCRPVYFDRVIDALRPKILIAVGRYASEHLYRMDTIAGRSEARWDGVRKRHATSEDAVIGAHHCKVIFVLQPSSHVSMVKRDAARDMIAKTYREMLNTPTG